MRFITFQTNIGISFFSLLMILAQPAFAKAGEQDLQKRLAKIVEDSKISKNNLGIYIFGDNLQYNNNAEKLMIPASVTKVATAAAVLEGFPVGHQFVTELRSGGRISDETLTGDLCLHGGGDAGFVSESMWFLVNEFHRTGIRKIIGDISVDDTFLDNVRFDQSRDQERVDRAYDAPIGAMTFNWSAVNVYVRPGLAKGQPAKVWVDPEGDYFSLSSTAQTASGGKTQLKVSHDGRDKTGKEKISVSGSIPVDAPEFVAYKAVLSPELWAASNLRAFLNQRGISIEGITRASKCSANAKSLAIYKSKPVGELVQSMMKFSNNYIAEIITKNLGAHANGKQGTMSLGVGAIRKYLQGLGLSENDFVLENPSGLSRTNRMSAQTVVRILTAMQKDFRLFPEFVASLPISGVDGTLKRRSASDMLKGKIRAKTGHLTGVASLAGYVSAADGNMISFAMIHNGKADESYAAKKLFDDLTQELAK